MQACIVIFKITFSYLFLFLSILFLFFIKVLQNIDDLFERDELSAAPDSGWPDVFNSGVFVYKPSKKTYQELIQMASKEGSFDGKT